MDFFDYWRTFNSRFDEGDLTALTQLVGYKLLAIDNERKHPESFLLTDRELMSRTNIKSGQTIVEARRQLKNAGLIDFKTTKNKPTRYWFSIKHEPSTNQVPDKHEPSTGQAQGLVSYTQAREERKMKERKRPDDARAREWERVTGRDENCSCAKPLSSPYAEEAGIHDIWEKTFGYALCGNRALELERMSSLDKAKAKEGIRRTKKRNDTLRRERKQGLADHFSYFKAVYECLKTVETKEEVSPEEEAARRKAEADERVRKQLEYLDSLP